MGNSDAMVGTLLSAHASSWLRDRGESSRVERE